MPGFLRLLPFLVATGCATHYAYVPTTNATATVRGRVAADYPIPPSAPQGDVRLASYGLTDVSPTTATQEHGSLRAIHLRVVLANNGAAPWTFNTQEQRIELEDGEVFPAAFASANAGTPPPDVTVDTNGRRVVDLFFLLPPGLQHADAIPEFDALWRVKVGQTEIAERTPFERIDIEPDYGDYDDWDYGPGYYWGGPYWMNPYYPWGPWWGGVPYGYAGGVYIGRYPHFWHGGRSGAWHGGFHGGFHGGGHVGGGRR